MVLFIQLQNFISLICAVCIVYDKNVITHKYHKMHFNDSRSHFTVISFLQWKRENMVKICICASNDVRREGEERGMSELALTFKNFSLKYSWFLNLKTHYNILQYKSCVKNTWWIWFTWNIFPNDNFFSPVVEHNCITNSLNCTFKEFIFSNLDQWKFWKSY